MKTGKSTEVKSKKSGAPTMTIAPTSINKAKTVSKSKKAGKSVTKAKASKSTTSIAPSLTNSPTSTNSSSKQKEGRATETRIFETSVNGEAVETTNGSDQNKIEEEGVIFTKSGGNTDKSTGTSTSSTTIFGLVVTGVVFCGVGVGVYMKMRTPSPIDEN